MRSLGIIRSYNDLQELLRQRSTALGMRRLDLDARAGLADGHAGKLLAPNQPKRFGWVSLGLVLQALGVRLIMVEDRDEQLEPIDACASTMARRRATKLSSDRRREIAAQGARARWHRQQMVADPVASAHSPAAK